MESVNGYLILLHRRPVWLAMSVVKAPPHFSVWIDSGGSSPMAARTLEPFIFTSAFVVSLQYCSKWKHVDIPLHWIIVKSLCCPVRGRAARYSQQIIIHKNWRHYAIGWTRWMHAVGDFAHVGSKGTKGSHTLCIYTARTVNGGGVFYATGSAL